MEYVSQRPPVQGVFPSMAEGKMPPAQVAASDLHHVCRWSSVLVDGRITPQAQGAKVRAQGAKVRTEDAKVRTSIYQGKSVRDAATTFNYYHHY